MNEKDFINWLKGYIEGKQELNSVQLKRIKDKLVVFDNVFDKTNYPKAPEKPLEISYCSNNRRIC